MRWLLLTHGATPTSRAASFPGSRGPADGPGHRSPDDLDEAGRQDAVELAGRLRRVDTVHCSPTARCRDTAALAVPHGPTARVDPGLAGPDLGRWAGRTLAEVACDDPAGLQAWTTDPAARPHGGESLVELVTRVGAALDAHATSPGIVALAVVDPIVLRAALVHVLRAPADTLARLDAAPLTLATVTRGPGGWHLRSLRPTGPTPDDELVAREK